MTSVLDGDDGVDDDDGDEQDDGDSMAAASELSDEKDPENGLDFLGNEDNILFVAAVVSVVVVTSLFLLPTPKQPVEVIFVASSPDSSSSNSFKSFFSPPFPRAWADWAAFSSSRI